MPIFFVGTAWLLAMILGTVCLFPRSLRYLSTHLILGSTIGFALSFILSTGPIFLLFLVPEDTRVQLGEGMGAAGAVGLLLGYLLAMLAGCILGFFLGSRLALKLNLFLGWQQRNDRLSDAWSMTVSTLKDLFKGGPR
jgi:hypothetical protein